MSNDKQEKQTKTVKDFCAAWDRMDLDAIMEYMSEDAVYDNLPLETLKGQEAIANFIGGFFQIATSAKFDILNLTADENRVVTERVDSFGFAEGGVDKLPVLGIFEFNDEGKINAWREYWDMQMWLDKGGPALS
ncbi:MAG TPA: limonene-1,2-epoxide hydrolase [Thiotrichaceae bacterium]|jgi:limonene-1,2-epoxide hydrolase|nr:limonene-1,2-epoxide hydrolase [Thiotrichaceae bacterium]HIM08018.1 limonene-1,2-epoxide hydrolase [Gammaproteobacteria bacterium]